MAGTLVDLCVVQESWKFWTKSEVKFGRGRVPQSEESGLLSSGFSNHSNDEDEPLLSSYGDSSIGSSVQIQQPNQKERGNVITKY